MSLLTTLGKVPSIRDNRAAPLPPRKRARRIASRRLICLGNAAVLCPGQWYCYFAFPYYTILYYIVLESDYISIHRDYMASMQSQLLYSTISAQISVVSNKYLTTTTEQAFPERRLHSMHEVVTTSASYPGMPYELWACCFWRCAIELSNGPLL